MRMHTAIVTLIVPFCLVPAAAAGQEASSLRARPEVAATVGASHSRHTRRATFSVAWGASR
jgi:hypothetical protein